jgi:hypothetical protein
MMGSFSNPEPEEYFEIDQCGRLHRSCELAKRLLHPRNSRDFP